jgi:hypothetical protein
MPFGGKIVKCYDYHLSDFQLPTSCTTPVIKITVKKMLNFGHFKVHFSSNASSQISGLGSQNMFILRIFNGK